MQDAIVSNKRLLRSEEFATLIGFHPETVRRLIREQRIRAIKFGDEWRIKPEEVDRIMQNGLPCGGGK